MTDYGALSNIDRKGRVTLPPDLIAIDRPDPENPNRTVRGVQRVDYLARIIGPDRRQWDSQDRLRYWAAELYRDDHAIGEDGANPNPADSLPSLRQGGPGAYGPTDGRVDALGRLRDATAVLDAPLSRIVVRDVVVRGIPLHTLVARLGKRRPAVRHALMVGLDALTLHYEKNGR